MSSDMTLADIFVILLITIGPLKATIVYAELTGKADSAFKRRVAFKTVTVATIVCLIFVFAGHWLLGVMVVVAKIVGLLLAALAIQLMISSFRDLGVIAPATAAH